MSIKGDHFYSRPGRRKT